MENTKSQSGERDCKLKIIDILVRGYSDDANYADLDNEVADKLWELIEGLISESKKEGIGEGYQNCLDDMNEDKAYKENRLGRE